jgi:hypothetical protein
MTTTSWDSMSATDPATAMRNRLATIARAMPSLLAVVSPGMVKPLLHAV